MIRWVELPERGNSVVTVSQRYRYSDLYRGSVHIYFAKIKTVHGDDDNDDDSLILWGFMVYFIRVRFSYIFLFHGLKRTGYLP